MLKVRGTLFQSTLPARGATGHAGQRGGAQMIFQSTLPARGATSLKSSPAEHMPISIHAPCTGSDASIVTKCWQYAYFNPRSLHGERRARTMTVCRTCSRFQSTLPARGATHHGGLHLRAGTISIHAPCTGSDRSGQINFSMSGHFNPRSLHGERPPSRMTRYVGK